MTKKDKKMIAAAIHEDPLFRSVGETLRFAFNYVANLPESAIAALAGGAKPAGRGLGGYEGAAQAGMIQAELTKLPTHRRMILAARTSVARASCACGHPCCVGYTERREWAEAINWLSEYVLLERLTGTISHYRVRRTIVARYFGDRTSLAEVAARAKISRNTASLYSKRVFEHMAKEEKLAWIEAGNLLEAARLIPGGV